ncbi:BlaI/MecI/CopY family transcriptional regulator [Streptomyces sp. NBC_01176]|uniref:BlaI/MecI/CopY family transcriptional regulator n=1 Tax=Streptomyces sp. NBC_01176 TaxID=2903760 RepID=UPI002F91B7B9
MPTKSAAATIRSRYMEQAASDLQDNHRQQNELQRQLEALRQEEKLLLDILNLAEHSTTVPEQARATEPEKAPSTDAKGKSPRHPRAVRAARRESSRKDKAPRGRAARRPLLGDLLLDLLKKHDKPRLAQELREELIEAHPDRVPTPQVVRNTLEGLVAKGLVQRHKQDRSVMYTPITSGGAVPDGH